MEVRDTGLPGVRLIAPTVHSDDRGNFMEAWHGRRFRELGLPNRWAQVNLATSRRGVLRGLHLQHPGAQTKLVMAVVGVIFDVAVDVRRGSPRFGEWVGEQLDAGSGRQLFIPAGFAHGYLVLSDSATVVYFASSAYAPADEITVRWDDPAIAIQWPVSPEALSMKDAAAPTLDQLPPGRLPAVNGR
jgi:dTDP-4-dehydrorhamnose 3,5-epimerase